VVVDVLTRYPIPIFIPVPDVTTNATVKALEEHVYTKFGFPDVIISDEGPAFKSTIMERHCARNGIYQDIVSPGNHKANGLAERYVGTLHDTMTQVPDKKLGEWYKYCEPIAHCLRVTPCSDTEVSPLEMLTGRRAKHPYHQPVDITFVRSDPVGKDERRKAYVRARKVMKYEQEHSEEPVRAYVRNVQTFSANELVRMKVEGSQAPALMGRPRKWTQRWAKNGTVLGPVEGHPDQYWIRRSTTGRVVRRSASTLLRATEESAEASG